MSRMKLQRGPAINPFMSTMAHDVDFLNESIQRMFENPLIAMRDPGPLAQVLGWYPPVEVAETDTELTLTAELPGMDAADIKLEVEGDMLTLRGEKRGTHVEEGKKREFYLEERTYGAFRRSFTLPRSVDSQHIDAAFDKGVLTLRMPKVSETKPRGREIPINAGQVKVEAPAPAPAPKA